MDGHSCFCWACNPSPTCPMKKLLAENRKLKAKIKKVKRHAKINYKSNPKIY